MPAQVQFDQRAVALHQRVAQRRRLSTAALGQPCAGTRSAAAPDGPAAPRCGPVRSSVELIGQRGKDAARRSAPRPRSAPCSMSRGGSSAARVGASTAAHVSAACSAPTPAVPRCRAQSGRRARSPAPPSSTAGACTACGMSSSITSACRWRGTGIGAGPRADGPESSSPWLRAQGERLAVQPVFGLEMPHLAKGDGQGRALHEGRKCTGAVWFVHGKAPDLPSPSSRRHAEPMPLASRSPGDRP
jgi:hypothetical protein